jgi:hypothetical protein
MQTKKWFADDECEFPSFKHMQFISVFFITLYYHIKRSGNQIEFFNIIIEGIFYVYVL